MEDLLYQSLMKYYGLDWLAFASGMAGMFLLTKKSRWGFLLSSLSSLSGFTVAALSLQFGFVIYNFLLIMVMIKGYRDWGRERVRR
jgi:hypothetical protein